MKKLILLFLVCFSAITGFAEIATVGTSPVTSPQQDFWTPGNLWMLICAVLVMAFVYLMLNALSGATIALSKQVENKPKS